MNQCLAHTRGTPKVQIPAHQHVLQVEKYQGLGYFSFFQDQGWLQRISENTVFCSLSKTPPPFRHLDGKPRFFRPNPTCATSVRRLDGQVSFLDDWIEDPSEISSQVATDGVGDGVGGCGCAVSVGLAKVNT